MPKARVKATVMATTMLSRVGRRGAWRERVAMATEGLAAEALAADPVAPLEFAEAVAASAGSLSGLPSAGSGLGKYIATSRRR